MKEAILNHPQLAVAFVLGFVVLSIIGVGVLATVNDGAASDYLDDDDD